MAETDKAKEGWLDKFLKPPKPDGKMYISSTFEPSGSGAYQSIAGRGADYIFNGDKDRSKDVTLLAKRDEIKVERSMFSGDSFWKDFKAAAEKIKEGIKSVLSGGAGSNSGQETTQCTGTTTRFTGHDFTQSETTVTAAGYRPMSAAQAAIGREMGLSPLQDNFIKGHDFNKEPSVKLSLGAGSGSSNHTITCKQKPKPQ